MVSSNQNGPTDKEIKFATDIAYLDLHLLENHDRDQKWSSDSLESEAPNQTIGDMLRVSVDGEGRTSQDQLNSLVDPGGDMKGDGIVSLDASIVNQLPSEVLDNWTIVDTWHQSNNAGGSGLYVTTIDTGHGIIVSFRGSEDIAHYQNLKQDWMQSDLGLLAGITRQQEDIKTFMNELKQDGFFEKYDNITFAGHSLGGNGAEFATFYAAEIGVVDRIDRTVSYDGPGFSQEFLEENKSYIEQATSSVQMDHYIQSFVGTILQQVDGIDYQYAQIKGWNPVAHSTDETILTFDPVTGKLATSPYPNSLSTILAVAAAPLSQGVDRLLGPKSSALLVQSLVAILDAGQIIKNQFYKNGQLTAAGKAAITVMAVGVAVAVIAAGPVVLVTATAALMNVVVNTISVVLWTAAGIIVYETLHDIADFIESAIKEYVPKIVDGVVKAIGQFGHWAGEQIRTFSEMVVNGVIALFNGLKNLFGSKRNEQASPHIRLDTYKLQQYADRLDALKHRISAVDSSLNALYFTEGLLDIIHLMIAEKLPTHKQMNRVIEYLRQTATDFERVEQKAMSI